MQVGVSENGLDAVNVRICPIRAKCWQRLCFTCVHPATRMCSAFCYVWPLNAKYRLKPSTYAYRFQATHVDLDAQNVGGRRYLRNSTSI